jgi:hypothetical protein
VGICENAQTMSRSAENCGRGRRAHPLPGRNHLHRDARGEARAALTDPEVDLAQAEKEVARQCRVFRVIVPAGRPGRGPRRPRGRRPCAVAGWAPETRAERGSHGAGGGRSARRGAMPGAHERSLQVLEARGLRGAAAFRPRPFPPRPAPPLPSLPVPPAPPLPSPLLPPLPAPPSRALPAPSARPALERPRDRAAGPRRAPVALLRARGGVGGGSRSRVGGGRWDPSCPPLLANSSVRGEQVPKGCPQDGEDQDSPEDPRALSARTELGWKDLGFPLHPALEPSFQEVASCGARPNRTEPNERERGNWLNPVLPSPLVYPRDGRPR